MKLKKITALVLTFMMALSIVGCGDNTQNNESNQGTDSEAATEAADTPETIKLKAPQLGFTEEQIQLAKDTAKANGTPLTNYDNFYIGTTEKIANDFPNYEVEYLDWGWAEELDQKQRASILAGDVPSLVAGETFMPVYAASGMLEPLPQDIIDMVNPSFLLNDNDGTPVGLAYKSSIFMLFYNKTLMKNAGLDPEQPPKTWEEWAEMSKIITEKGAGKVYGGGIPSFPHFGGSLRATPFFRQLGVDFGGGTEVNLLDPKLQETLQYIRDMNANFPAGLGNSSDEGPLWTEFEKNQTVAFVVNGSWQQAKLVQNDVDWGVTTLPLPEGGAEANCLVGAVFVGVPKAAEHKDACFDLMRVLLDSELQKNWLKDTVPSPLNIYVEDDSLYKDNTTLKVAMEALKNGTYTGLTTFDKNDAQVWETINTKVLARTTMTNDPIDVICSEAQAEIENLLK